MLSGVAGATDVVGIEISAGGGMLLLSGAALLSSFSSTLSGTLGSEPVGEKKEKKREKKKARREARMSLGRYVELWRGKRGRGWFDAKAMVWSTVLQVEY